MAEGDSGGGKTASGQGESAAYHVAAESVPQAKTLRLCRDTR